MVIRVLQGFIARRWSSSKNSAIHNPPPLDGIRIVDLTRILGIQLIVYFFVVTRTIYQVCMLAGPYCTMILGDLGADVIKIEETSKGDETRSWGPPFVQGKTQESAYFLCVNRNKRSVCVDLKREEGKQIIRDLVKVSDVFVENYIPGKLDQMGLGYEDLSAINPGLVYASISGYGPNGPYAKKPGYDVIIEAEAGLMHITGQENGDPVKVGVAMTDLTTGLYTHGAILAALIARSKTKRGQKIDASLLECQVASLANIASNYLVSGNPGKRWGTAHASIVPYQAFNTQNGKIVFGIGNDRQFKILCDRIGMSKLAQDPKYETNQKRVAHREELVNTLQAQFSTNTNAYWLKMLSSSGIPIGPVNDIAQTFAHEQVKHREMIVEIDHPSVGPIKLAGIPVEYSDTSPRIRYPPPVHGQHTKEVLGKILQYSDDKINGLEAIGAISISTET